VFLIIGIIVVFGSIIGGYLNEHGNFAVLIQPNEFLIIGGAALGSMVIGNSPATIKRCGQMTLGLLKPNPFNSTAYEDLLQVLYKVFQKARKDGLVGLESHIENPESSDIFQKYPSFMGNHHAVSLLCDTLKVLLTGTVEDHNLAEILDVDLEKPPASFIVLTLRKGSKWPDNVTPLPPDSKGYSPAYRAAFRAAIEERQLTVVLRDDKGGQTISKVSIREFFDDDKNEIIVRIPFGTKVVRDLILRP
jgi:hypothetical protein